MAQVRGYLQAHARLEQRRRVAGMDAQRFAVNADAEVYGAWRARVDQSGQRDERRGALDPEDRRRKLAAFGMVQVDGPVDGSASG